MGASHSLFPIVCGCARSLVVIAMQVLPDTVTTKLCQVGMSPLFGSMTPCAPATYRKTWGCMGKGENLISSGLFNRRKIHTTAATTTTTGVLTMERKQWAPGSPRLHAFCVNDAFISSRCRRCFGCVVCWDRISALGHTKHQHKRFQCFGCGMGEEMK